ncbi:BTAD domain-containing putative transcriptional regulator [Saccharothrix sp.]|uniref:AfsR/SARP family transcriptional regulator n=1 Tax=Saccharothrix sp. TaxID=1873460 RepID=UPI0028110DB4|nr:BTAD domain-containing putative transcriptional regulator [Saccharothrix sp.]
MRFGVLGPLEIRAADGTPVRVVERKVRLVLAVLLADAGRPVSVDRLVDALWPDRPPGNPVRAVQAKVAQLRRALEDAEPGGRELVRPLAPGYVVHADLDADRFTALTGRARRADDLPRRAELLADALALWRGPAFADFADDEFARPVVARLDEARLTALEDHAETRLALGDHAALPAELGELVARHPLRERLRAVHLRALHRSGRQAEALAGYEELRRRLADDLGVDPGPDLTALYRAILTQDAAEAAPPTPAPAAPTPAPTPAPPAPASAVPGPAVPAPAGPPAPPAHPTAATGPAPATGLTTAGGPTGPTVGTGPTSPVAVSGPVVVSALPVPATPLVGRADLVADVGDRLATDRLVTLVGPGGVGKTRLALEVGRRARFPDGVRLADLTGPRTPLDVVAAALDVRDDGTWGLDPVLLVDRIGHALRDRRLLLVLDNCEHVMAEVAALVRDLLDAAPGLRVLATSREPLAIAGEVLAPVPPLPEADAVRLFTERAAAVAPGVPLDDDAVTALCRRLDGLPLALELAATKVRALGVRGVLDRLDDRFRLLRDGYRDASARHRTLRAVVDWSWELLTDTERRVLSRLAVHADGCTVEAAEHVSAVDDVLEALIRLVDRSLVVVGDGPRYRLLESVAAYGVERLAEAGELDEARRRHVEHYTAYAERARLRGPEQGRWLDLLDTEAANMHAALAHADPAHAARLADALVWHWVLRGRLGEALRTLAPVASPSAQAWRTGIAVLTGDGADRARRIADALAREPDTRSRWFLGHALCCIGDLAAGERLVEAALHDFRAEGDRWGEAAALADRATVHLLRGDLDCVAEDGGRSAELFTELGDQWGRLRTVMPLAMRAEVLGDYDEAGARLGEGVVLARRLGLWTQVADLTAGLARIALLRHDHATARILHEQARDLAAAHGHRAGEVNAVLGLGLGARRAGELDTAETHLRAVLRWHHQVGLDGANALVLAELGFIAELRGDPATALDLQRQGYAAAERTADPRALALALEGLAGAHALAGHPATAAVLLGAADTARRSRCAPLPEAERGDVDRITAKARAALGPDFPEHFTRGTNLTPPQARAFADAKAPRTPAS